MQCALCCEKARLLFALKGDSDSTLRDLVYALTCLSPANEVRRGDAGMAKAKGGVVRFKIPLHNSHPLKSGESLMLGWSLLFFIVALVAGILGFTGIAGTAVGIAKILFFVFLVLLVVSALIGALRGRPSV